MTVLDTASVRKARGAFFTPPELCRYMSDWAVTGPDDLVLEPSCGDAGFLLAAGERLRALRGGPPRPGQLTGVELHGASAETAAERLQEAGLTGRVTEGDFFDYTPRACYDAVVGNPPYIRYQSFTGATRVRSQELALAHGVRLTGLASSWAAFTVHAALFLKPGGRLGLVLPAELLSVNYAAVVRSFLLRRFRRVRLVLFEQRVFPGVQEEVVLLLADGQGPATHTELQQVGDLDGLLGLDRPEVVSWPAEAGGKWTAGLLPTSVLTRYRSLEDGPGFAPLADWGKTTLGAVTGGNDFFALSPRRVAELGLTDDDLVGLSPPGSRHLRLSTFTPAMWRRLGIDGARTQLFRPSKEPSAAGWRYIRHGEDIGVAEAYKCRVREPWWRVPLQPPADLFLTYMNAETVQLATNRAGVQHLNSVHGVALLTEHRAAGRDLLPLAALNSLTLLGAEIVGRAYGGGMLKLEPREASQLPVPSPSLVEEAARELRRLRPRARRLLSAGNLQGVVALVDEALCRSDEGVLAGVEPLREGYRRLRARRAARGRAPASGSR